MENEDKNKHACNCLLVAQMYGAYALSGIKNLRKYKPDCVSGESIDEAERRIRHALGMLDEIEEQMKEIKEKPEEGEDPEIIKTFDKLIGE